MTTDPKDAGIARYDLDLMESRMVKDQWGGEWVRHSDHAAEIARLKSALAESEAAAEGALMILVQTQAERDAALAQAAALREVVKFHERLTVDPSTLSRRDAQMRAEGMRKAVEVADSWQADENKPMTMRASILVAAEKEAQG